MSHIVQIQTQIRDAAALAAACQRLAWPTPSQQTVKFFNSTATGLAVSIPGWRYPVVCDVGSGQSHFDNFNGAWGEQARFDRLVQAYAVCMAQIEARKRGHTVTEQALPNGAIKLTIQIAGGAA